jgi:hypothetical protein
MMVGMHVYRKNDDGDFLLKQRAGGWAAGSRENATRDRKSFTASPPTPAGGRSRSELSLESRHDQIALQLGGRVCCPRPVIRLLGGSYRRGGLYPDGAHRIEELGFEVEYRAAA